MVSCKTFSISSAAIFRYNFLMKKAIFLSGGGARGAYQAGVLQGISEILNCKQLPVEILSSVSAGSINSAFLAVHADDFACGTDKLVKLWSNLHCGKIFDTRNLSLIKSVIRNTSSIAFRFNIPGGQYLLDTTPLKKTLAENIDFDKLNKQINDGKLEAFEVAASCYDIAKTISFYHSRNPDQQDWSRDRHISQKTHIRCDHLLASSAFPLFFPAIKIDDLNFGDGGLRYISPLRASIRMGADAILVIGTRRASPPPASLKSASIGDITYAHILGNMMNALFLDSLEIDLRLLSRINEHATLIPDSAREQHSWRNIKVLYLHPSIDIGKLAEGKQKVLPSFLRYLMNAFGTTQQSGDVMSFLLFEAAYTKELIDCGYEDALAQREQILRFFSL